MYDQVKDDIIFIMSYAVVTAVAILASCYLLFRQGNAFAANVTPPLRLRRWTAAFFASIALNHAWYMPIFFLTSNQDVKMTDLIGGCLDSMTFFPLAIIVPLTMLQDRRRPLWPVAVVLAPLIIGAVVSAVNGDYILLPTIYVYCLLMCIGIIIYMVRALREYGRWLRDNYADLEHKEVWQSFVVLAAILLVFFVYAFTASGVVYQYVMQIIIFILIGYLLWRVETLSDLSIQTDLAEAETKTCESSFTEDNSQPQTIHDNIGQLLQQHCIDTQLYLQQDLTVIQLAKAVGTNRLYLSQYFSTQGITYNAYINDLRINHFMRLYHDAIDNQRPFTALQLANESGYRSYSTFGIAFKQRMGQTVTAWMRDTAK